MAGSGGTPPPADNTAKTLIALPVGSKENQTPCTIPEVASAVKTAPELEAGDWANSSGTALMVETNLPVQILEIRESEGEVAESGRSFDQLVNGSGSVTERIVTLYMQRDEHKVEDFSLLIAWILSGISVV